MVYVKRNGAEQTGWSAGVDRFLHDVTRQIDGLMEYSPTLDIAESAAEWKVRVELPGVAPEDVAVAVTGNVLTIRGEKKGDAPVEGENRRRSERAYGKFVRVLEFPTDVDAKKVEAAAKNGVLTIKLPKAEAAMPKTIDIKVE